MKNNENVKERKSFKEVVVENKGKIIAGVSIVTASAVGIVLVKNNKDMMKLLDRTVKVQSAVTTVSEVNTIANDMLWEKVNVTENIIVNSGIIEQARATIIRKRDNLISKLNCLENMQQLTDDVVNKIAELKGGISGFDKMLDQCDELEYLYKAREVAENLLED